MGPFVYHALIPRAQSSWVLGLLYEVYIFSVLAKAIEEEVGAKQICDKATSLTSQFFKTFTLDQKIVLKNWEIVLKNWEIVFKETHYDL